MLYDAVGIHFDPRCLQRRLASAILAWSRGEPMPGQQHTAPTERRVWAAWNRALGPPPTTNLVPGARARAWQAACSSL
eukprot:3102421-Pyramimonas_sp.AAC.1